MKTWLHWFSSHTDFSTTPHQKWSLIYMTLNVKNVSEKNFNVLMTLVTILQKTKDGQMENLHKNPEIMPQVFENREPSTSLLIDNSHCKVSEPQNTITIPTIYLQNTKKSTADISMGNTEKTSSFMTQLSDNTPPTLNKTTCHPKPPYFCVIYIH